MLESELFSISGHAAVLKLVVDVLGSSDGRLDGCFNPSVSEAGVFPSEVNPALGLEELRRVISMLVGSEHGVGSQAVGVRAPLLHHHPRAQVPDLLPVDELQVLQGHLLQLLIPQALEEQRVVRPGVGGQQHADGWVLGEAVAGVVDEARGAVCDALPPLDAIILPEPSAEGEDDLGGAVVVNAAQCMPLSWGQPGDKL